MNGKIIDSTIIYGIAVDFSECKAKVYKMMINFSKEKTKVVVINSGKPVSIVDAINYVVNKLET